MTGEMDEGDAATRARRLYEAGKRELAARFDPERGLIRQVTEEGAFHPTRESLRYARCLLHDAGGDDADSTLAARIIEAVLAVQERQPGNIHEGGFPWMADDGHVTDLNAVEFVLEELCHILLESERKLPPPVRDAIRAAMQLGLAEIARLDVDPAYTNICLLDCHNSILGGQLLGAPGWAERGARKLTRWAAHTARSGAPREYNSPTYGGVDLTALAAIAEGAADPAVRLLARIMEERLWLHVATHYHAPTAQLAGPHSRAYQNDVTGGRGSLKAILYLLLGDERLMKKTPFYPQRQGEGNVHVGLATYHCPAPLRRLLTGKGMPFTVREVADATTGLDLGSTLTDDWALGVASYSYGPQADNLILHYRKDTEPGFGVAYARFILNDKRLGGSFHATDRTRSNNISDAGDFRGLHVRNKAIGVYGLLPQMENLTSIKLDLFFPGRAGLGRILANGEPVAALPVELPPGVPLIVEDGAVYIGALPLRHSNLGRTAPVRLEEDGGDLVLSTTIYEGPAKRFWEYAILGGPFYRGNIECGIVLEVAAREEFPDAAAFAAHLAAAGLEDVTVDGVRSIRYRSGGDELLLRYQLVDPRTVEQRVHSSLQGLSGGRLLNPGGLEVLERRVNGEPLAPAPLDSPLALQRGEGPLVLDGVRLDAPVEPRANWLYTDPGDATVVAVRATTEPGPWELRLADSRRLAADALGLARVECDVRTGRVKIETAGDTGGLALHGWPARPTLVHNGKDVSGGLREGRAGEWRWAGD